MKRDVEKLKMLLSHWIRHNEEHKNEYKKWLERVKGNVSENIIESFEKVIELSEQSNKYLKSILDKMEKEGC